MELKKLLGEAYREDMTLTEIEEALSGVNLIDKSLFDKTASELAKEKKRAKDLEQSTLSEQEKVEQAIAEANRVAEDAQKELAKISARNVFLEKGMTESQFAPFLALIDTVDKETAIARATEISDIFVSQKTDIEKSVRKEILKDTPKPEKTGEEAPGGVTYEAFSQMGYEQRLELKQTNPQVYGEYIAQETKTYGGI